MRAVRVIVGQTHDFREPEGAGLFLFIFDFNRNTFRTTRAASAIVWAQKECCDLC